MNDRTPMHLRSILSDQAGDHEENDSALPSPHDNQLQAYGRPVHRPLYAIHFIDPDGTVRTFQYIHLDSDSCYASGQIVLRFSGSKIVNVMIDGRNLWELYDYIHQHRMPWVRAAARDFARDQIPIVTRIAIVEAEQSSHL